MRLASTALAMLLLAAPATAQPATAQPATAADIIAKNLAARGGETALAALKSVRFDGKLVFPGGFELTYNETRANGAARVEAALQGLALVQAYDDLPVPVWHVDLYRLDQPAEADALGLFETDAALIIEWPQRLGNRLPADALHLMLEGSGDAPRRLTWTAPPAWEGRWPPPLPK
jgi:hypothetical protein